MENAGLIVSLADINNYTRITILWSMITSVATVVFTVPIMYVTRIWGLLMWLVVIYPERASVLDFKDATIPRFGHSNVVFDLFIETRFSHLITLLFNFSYCMSKVPQIPLIKHFLLMMMRYRVMFVTKNRQKTTSLWPNRETAVSLKSLNLCPPDHYPYNIYMTISKLHKLVSQKPLVDIPGVTSSKPSFKSYLSYVTAHS